MEVVKELFSADVVTAADGSAKSACAWVAAEVGFGKEDEMDTLLGGGTGRFGKGGDSGGGGEEGMGLGNGEFENLGHGCLTTGMVDRTRR